MINWPTNPSSRTSQSSVHYGARKLGELAKIVTGKIDANRQIRPRRHLSFTVSCVEPPQTTSLQT